MLFLISSLVFLTICIAFLPFNMLRMYKLQ
ncbi:hypothetical protein GC56T2_3408 [Geobacillus sp. C56-T2]|nr:hypothetical protein GC56T2_3408 [Geobacillus sp. C56-T2]